MVSTLSYMERRLLEAVLDMRGGGVLDFYYRSDFRDFVLDSTGLDIEEERFAYGSNSKANELRGFWKLAPDHAVGRLLHALLDLRGTIPDYEAMDDNADVLRCRNVADRLLEAPVVDDFEALSGPSGEREFEMLAKDVRQAVVRGEPEAGMDRLHTFVVKFVRALCRGRDIATEGKPLQSIFGEYVKALDADGVIETEMTRRILKSSISVLDAFNAVRNRRSFAHDNVVLRPEEALLIVSHVAAIVRFLQSIEPRREAISSEEGPAPSYEDLPF